MFGVFRVKNHDFTQKKIIFSQISGGRAPGAPPGSAPGRKETKTLDDMLSDVFPETEGNRKM
jgi:hypothetical protein